MKGSELVDLVREVVVAACSESILDDLEAIVLTGSMARDEAGVAPGSAAHHRRGDIDLLLIVRSRSPLPHPRVVNDLARQAEHDLGRAGLPIAVTLAAVHPAFLRRLRPHIFAYELRACGKVLWGQPEILSLIPALSAGAIPLEDGWRLLCNRMIEMLEAIACAAPTPVVTYKAVKLWLDMATSLLLFAGRYAPSYRLRARCLEDLAGSYQSDETPPFDLTGFAELVTVCTRWKLDPDATSAPRSHGRTLGWPEAIPFVRKLWRWELLRLTGSPPGSSEHELLGAWLHSQPIAARLRGWISLVARRPRLGDLGSWSPSTSSAWCCSPRYRTYAAASELFFALPELSDASPSTASSALEPLWRMLALPRPRTDRDGGWRQLARCLASDYHRFLESTRA